MEITKYKNKKEQEYIKQVKICCPEMSRTICEGPQIREVMYIPFFSLRTKLLHIGDKAIRCDYCPYCGEKIKVTEIKKEYDPNTESTI